MKRFFPILALVLFLPLRVFGEEEAAGTAGIYDPDPAHLWNRLNETLFVRTAQDGKKFGRDELDILYWPTTRNLFFDPSRQKALAALDEFIDTHGEKLIRDPMKRALLQRDLWELFDWSARSFANSEEGWAAWVEVAKDFRSANPPQTIRDLQSRLVLLIRRLALTTNEIASLPDNYLQAEKSNLPDLPRGMFETNGAWLMVGRYNTEPVAPTHVAQFEGHSAFCVMLHFPEGRSAAVDYLDRLRWFAQVDGAWNYRTNSQPWLATNLSSRPVYTTNKSGATNTTWEEFTWVSTNFPRNIFELRRDIPQFPTNTEWALVRQMCVIDTDGRIQPTSITESIQLRRYVQMKGTFREKQEAQQFFEFQLSRRQNGALRAIGKNEKGFPFVHFMGHGIDQFEFKNLNGQSKPVDSAELQQPLLQTCFSCHGDLGIYSVNSYTGFGAPSYPRHPTDLVVIELAREASAASLWKEQQFNWGLLQGLWRQRE